jgi:hypothetical protein
VVLAVFVALLFYSLNVFINNWTTFFSFYSALGFFGTGKLFFTLLFGFGNTIRLSSYLSLLVTSVFFGLLFSLVVYKVNILKVALGSAGIFASLGIFLGALVPGCVACGVGLLSLLGLSAAFLTFLPLQGLELSILSIFILSFAILKTSDDMYKCNISILSKNKNNSTKINLYTLFYN